MNKKKSGDKRYIIIACMVSFFILIAFFFNGYYDTKRNMKKMEEYNVLYDEVYEAIGTEQYHLAITKINELRSERQTNGCEKIDFHDSAELYYFAKAKLEYANGTPASEINTKYLQNIPKEYEGDFYFLIDQFRVTINYAIAEENKN